MTREEDFVIKTPYQPTDEEKQAITDLENKGLVADDWDSGKKDILSFKKNLRRDMYNKQNKRCAFCRIHVPSSCVPMHREHIVYKDMHPQWMFHPENLCIACPNCNSWKGTTEVLANPHTSTYPTTSDGFKIIHPLYDKYSDHIELIDEILYKGKTYKGTFTINTCHLYRVDLAEERVDIKMYAKNKGKIIAELIHLLTLSDQYIDEKDRFCEYVTEIVKKYKKRKNVAKTENNNDPLYQ